MNYKEVIEQLENLYNVDDLPYDVYVYIVYTGMGYQYENASYTIRGVFLNEQEAEDYASKIYGEGDYQRDHGSVDTFTLNTKDGLV